MKYRTFSNVIIVMLFSFISFLHSKETKFELWNSTNKAIYFNVNYLNQMPRIKKLHRVKPHKTYKKTFKNPTTINMIVSEKSTINKGESLRFFSVKARDEIKLEYKDGTVKPTTEFKRLKDWFLGKPLLHDKDIKKSIVRAVEQNGKLKLVQS